MDLDFWPIRVNPAAQAIRLNNSDNHNDMGDDDVRAWFPCPFCYVDIEVPAFCLHLHEEHCFDLKNAVCPICAANLGKDAIGHFTTQHAHSIKRRRKFLKTGSLSSSSMVIGKKMPGSDPMNDGRRTVSENEPDFLVLSFLCSIPLSDPKSNRDAEISCNSASTTSEAISTKSAVVLDEAQEQDYEEKRQRAEFVQQLILSTIF